MKVSSFIDRLHLSTFDWRKKINKRKKSSFLRRIFSERRRSLSSNERRDKKPIDHLSVCSPDNSNKYKFEEISWRLAHSFMLNGKCHGEKFSLFIPKISSTLFKQNKNRSTHRFSSTMQRWNLSEKNRLKTSTFLLQTKHFFLLCKMIFEKERVQRFLISTHRNRWTTVEEKQFSRSLKFIEAEKFKKSEEKTSFERETLQNIEKENSSNEMWNNVRKVQNSTVNWRIFDWTYKSKWK